MKRSKALMKRPKTLNTLDTYTRLALHKGRAGGWRGLARRAMQKARARRGASGRGAVAEPRRWEPELQWDSDTSSPVVLSR